MIASRVELTPLGFLLRSADVWAARPAVADGDTVATWAELLGSVERAVGALRGELGIAPGDRVALLLHNRRAMLELHFAVPGAEAVLVPLNTRLAAPEYAALLAHSGARAVIADEDLRGVLGPALEELGADAPQVRWSGGGGEGSWERAVAAAAPAPLSLPASEDDLLSINYTSGTTGRPKGVMTTHRGAYLHSLGVIAEAGLHTTGAYLWTLPMFHCNGWAYTWAVTAAGALHVCLPKPDPDAIWAAIDERGVTHMCAAPTVVIGMLGSGRATRCEPPVRLFVGGAPPAPATLERAAGLDVEVTHLYGLTETYGPIAVCAWNPDWDALDAPDQSRMRARQGVATVVSERLRVVDAAMADVPRDGTSLGEVVMRGNNVMTGYYRDPEATTEALAGGWFHSGDLGVMHPDGYIELRDRLKDVVISGGENISTVEVEQVLAGHPAIAEAAVVGVPDERWGEVPCAFLTLWDGATLDPAEVRGFVRSRLAGFKVPKRIEVVEELPKTATGKVQKFRLREMAAPDTGP